MSFSDTNIVEQMTISGATRTIDAKISNRLLEKSDSFQIASRR